MQNFVVVRKEWCGCKPAAIYRKSIPEEPDKDEPNFGVETPPLLSLFGVYPRKQTWTFFDYIRYHHHFDMYGRCFYSKRRFAFVMQKKTWNWIRSIVHRSGGYWNDTGGDLFASIIVCLFDELAPISGLAVAMLSANSWFLKEQVIIYHTWYYLDLETVPNGM